MAFLLSGGAVFQDPETGYEYLLPGGLVVQATEPPAVPVSPRRVEEGGRSRKKPSRRRRKPVLVEIDGESFVVNSEAEAVDLVDKAREAAEEKARAQAELILKKRQAKNAKDGRLNTHPFRLDEPQIIVRPADDGRIDQAWISEIDRLVNDEISNVYEAVARDFETRLLIEYRLAVDEEETLVALLLTI